MDARRSDRLAARMSDLADRKCKPPKKTDLPLAAELATKMMSKVQGWKMDGKSLTRSYAFENYYQTMAFVNAVAWIAHGEDHHPELVVGYNRCEIRYSTHTVGGLSENDFICAAKINRLI